MSERYAKSEALLRRARRSIPLGAQTFSKSSTHLPEGAAPFFLESGRGARVRDADGNEYIDLVNGLAAVLLGYADPDVDAAVRSQLERGVTFSLSHRLETEVAEQLVEMIPCAEQVRFGKNGSDATAAAVRLARAATGRDHVAVCGYHGWQDWYIGSTSRDLGVPDATRALTHPFDYGCLESLESLLARHPGGFAAVILEPFSAELPPPGYLEGVREAADRHGCLLVFDETVTGLRVAPGGAQELFDVTPDLATFGKGLANGHPLSAVVGPARWMRWMERIFYSTTFGGETLSLAAASAVLQKIRREPVVATLESRGRKLAAGVQELLDSHGLGDCLSLSGHPAWIFLNFSDTSGATAWELRTFFFQELFARGVLSLGTHNVSYALADAEVEAVLSAYRELLPALSAALRSGTLRESLRCEPLEPLFRVR